MSKDEELDKLFGFEPLHFKYYPYIRSDNWYCQSSLDVFYEVTKRDGEIMITSPMELFGQKFNSVENAIKACREHHKNLFLNQ